MEQKQTASIDFFLGTTTPAGFKGYFDALRAEPGRQMYLIKSGPGCGKSTLMKRLAARSEGPVERIHCSSDPDSYDGAVFCRSGDAIVDATAPHVMEPEAPGADEVVISMYHTLDRAKLAADREAVLALFARNRCLRGRAARYIASAGGLLLDSRRAAACNTDFEKVRRYTKRLCARLLPKTAAAGQEQLRLLSALTPQGEVVYTGTVRALADRCIVFRDDYGAASRLVMETIRTEALARGYTIYVCPCAMHPDDKVDHIFVPALRLAFLTGNHWHPMRLAGQKNIRCTRFMDTAHLANYRTRLRFNTKAAEELLQQAVALMAQAKSCHDELEAYYSPAVDFSAVEQLAQSCAAQLGLGTLPPRGE